MKALLINPFNVSVKQIEIDLNDEQSVSMALGGCYFHARRPFPGYRQECIVHDMENSDHGPGFLFHGMRHPVAGIALVCGLDEDDHFVDTHLCEGYLAMSVVFGQMKHLQALANQRICSA